MTVILDYIGAVVVGGLLLLSILGFQATTTEAAATHNLTSIAQSNLSSMTEIVDYDFRKIGYRVADTMKVVSINASGIAFRGDFDDNGSIDTLSYFTNFGFTKTTAERVKLYRKLNSQPQSMLSSEVSKFVISAYDASGAPTTSGSRVRSIKIALAIKSSQAIGDQYPSAYWERIIKPNNLR